MNSYTVIRATSEHLDDIVNFEMIKGMELENLSYDRDVIVKSINEFMNPVLKKGEMPLGYCLLALNEKKEAVGTIWVMHQLDARLGGLAYLIWKVFVVEEYRCKGVFRVLWDHVSDIAKKDEHAKEIRMYVLDYNDTAWNVYERYGCEKKDWSFSLKEFE